MASAMVEDANFEDDQLANMTTDDIVRASRLLDNEIRILKVPFSLSFLFLFIFSTCIILLCSALLIVRVCTVLLRLTVSDFVECLLWL